MFLDLSVGNLIEPLTGREWKRDEVMRRYRQRIAYYADQGLAPQDKVFLHYGNTLEFFVDLLAVWTLGACAVPIDARLTEFEVATLAQSAQPRFSLWHQSVEEGVRARLSKQGVRALSTFDADTVSEKNTGWESFGPRLNLDDPALILFTSGTTGQPKGVVHTHRSLRARWITLRQSLGLQKFRKTLCLLPTHFGHGLICNCLFPWLSGNDLHILPPFRPDIVLQLGRLIDQFGITFLSSVPTVWRLALKASKRPEGRSVERVFCGSAPLSAHLWKGIQDWTGAGEVCNAYGITETGSWVAGTTVPGVIPEDGLIGEPWGSVVRILKSKSTENPAMMSEVCAPGESGYVWLNTPALMKGYLGRDDLTNQVVSQGWFVTGDIGFIDDRGLLYLRGREREEINKGGMKIFPADIDAVVERYEETVDVCSFGYEDPLYGEDVGIALVLKPPQKENLKSLFAWMGQYLAKHQMPSRWFLLDEIPRTSRGKVSRADVASKCATAAPTDPRTVS
ncbi:MAG: class I adenylate-forming enzyme family protein [Acidobacteriota bacterium]